VFAATAMGKLLCQGEPSFLRKTIAVLHSHLLVRHKVFSNGRQYKMATD
jgi:hypothetical protein